MAPLVCGTGRPRLESLYARNDRIVLSCLTAAWMVSTASFWWWWFGRDDRRLLIGFVATTLVLLLSAVGPLWMMTALLRARRVVASPPVGLRVAMVVTRAPSEHFPMVQRTLVAMLDQDYGQPYDVWLADEDPNPVTSAWCMERGVLVSCRRGDPTYQQDSWPRRARTKEGNLAFFYDHWGYERYDVVVHLDADHIPTRGALRALVAPFANRSVGYVAAPSMVDNNAERSWPTRARLTIEAAMHGPIQAGHNDGWAPTCFGSMYAVRTEALRVAGGIGPELAEDFTTTLMLNAAGYTGAFAIDAEAHGDGPATLPDAMRQEMQWARSMTAVLLRVGRPWWGALPMRLRAKLGFSALWYPLLTAQMVLGHVLIMGAVLGGRPWVAVPIGDYVTNRALPALAMVAAIVYLARRGYLRPVGAKPLGWESALLTFLRWPWLAIGVWQGAWGRTTTWGVTPKPLSGPSSFGARTVWPHTVVAGALLLSLMFATGDTDTLGYRWLALLLGGAYGAAITVAAVLHRHEIPMVEWRHIRGPITVGIAIMGAFAGVAAWRWEQYGSPGSLAEVSVPTTADRLHAFLETPSTIRFAIAAAATLVFVLVLGRRGRAVGATQPSQVPRQVSVSRIVLTHSEEPTVLDLREEPSRR